MTEMGSYRSAMDRLPNFGVYHQPTNARTRYGRFYPLHVGCQLTEVS
jgi:hypothetical protein